MEEVISADHLALNNSNGSRKRLETLLECHESIDSIVNNSYLTAVDLKCTPGNYFYENPDKAEVVTAAYKNIQQINKEIIQQIKQNPSYSEKSNSPVRQLFYPVYECFCKLFFKDSNEPLARQKSEIKKLNEKLEMAGNLGNSYTEKINKIAEVADRIESLYMKYILMLNGSLDSKEDTIVVPFHGEAARHIKMLYSRGVYEIQKIKPLLEHARD